MPTQRAHALLAASASHRWLNCTAAPRFEEQFPDEGRSVYADEGSLAHKFCEELVRYNFHEIRKPEFERRWDELRKDALFQDEMIATADFYGRYLWERFMEFQRKAFVAPEVKVDLTDWIPEGMGTCDCVMFGGDHLHIADYKHGKGVRVSAQNNPQLRLYALGALKKFAFLFGDSIKTVTMAIVQPRITEDVDSETLTVEELLAWGERIKPIAQKAYAGKGEFHPGVWCRFCKARFVCRARAENATAFEDFKGIPIQGTLSPEEASSRSPVLSDAEVADLIKRGEWLVSWYEELKEYALQAILSGHTIPGFKVVAGKSNRAFSDLDAALAAIKKAGYEEAMLYERKAKTLTQLEKLLGKKKFEEIAGEFVVKPKGKPTLADESDKRPNYNSAEQDFQGISASGG